LWTWQTASKQLNPDIHFRPQCEFHFLPCLQLGKFGVICQFLSYKTLKCERLRSSVSTVTGLWTGQEGLHLWYALIFSLRNSAQTTSRFPTAHDQWVTGISCQTSSGQTFNAETENAWKNSSTPLCLFKTQCLIKHRYIFTLSLI